MPAPKPAPGPKSAPKPAPGPSDLANPAGKLANAHTQKAVKPLSTTPPTVKIRKRGTRIAGPGRGHKHPVTDKTKKTKTYGGGNPVGWVKKAYAEGRVDEYGLPIPPEGNGKRGPDIKPLLTLILDRYSRPEIQEMLDNGVLPDGTKITCRISMRLQEVLDAQSYDYRVRLHARKRIDDLTEGPVVQRIGNPDGTALNPLAIVQAHTHNKLTEGEGDNAEGFPDID